MSYFYKVPDRIRAAQWSATDSDKQSRFLSLLLSVGLSVDKVSNEEVCFGDRDVRHDEWVVIPASKEDIQVMSSWDFNQVYNANPQMESDRRHDGFEEDAPEEEEES